MKRAAIAIVSVVVLTLCAQRAHADASAERYAFTFFQGIATSNEAQVRWFLLSKNEAAAYYARVNEQGYARYVQSMWNEFRQMATMFSRYRQQHVRLQVVGVDITSTNAVAGGRFARPTVLVTVRPVYQGPRGRFVGDDTITLVKVNNYWKLHGMWFD